MFVIWVWTQLVELVRAWREGRSPAAPVAAAPALVYAKYFRPVPDPRVPLLWKAVGLAGDAGLVAALVLAVWQESLAAVGALVSWVVVSSSALAIMLDHRRAEAGLMPKPTDAQMDQRFAELLAKVDDEALAALHLTAQDLITRDVAWNAHDAVLGVRRAPSVRDGKPLLVLTPVLTSRSALGRDLGWRFARWDVVALCPTGRHLGVFKTRVDVVTGKLGGKQTDEFYYPDIVSVQTRGATADGVAFVPVDTTGAGVHDLPAISGRALLFCGPGTEQTVVTAVATPTALHDPAPPVAVTGVRPLQHIATYRSGLNEATQALRGWLRRDWAA